MAVWGRLHQTCIFPRRVRRLAALLAGIVPSGRVLDVGCGDGLIDSQLLALRPDLQLEGTEVLLRPRPSIPVMQFDGQHLPYGDSSFDSVLFVDVLHHTLDPMALLREARRVTKRWLIIKDHLLEGWLAGTRLRLMDYVGNAHHGVSLPYNYWRQHEWQSAERDLALTRSAESRAMRLYPWPADRIFDAGLHFLARFEVN
jgi:SAM-dependent methyltransferase